MYELKTKPVSTDPLQVISAIPNVKKQADAKALLDIFERATGQPPVVWGEKMIGYGSYSYRYATGHHGIIYACGFSVTKNKITLHLYLDEPQLQDYLRRLGKMSYGKSCVYINKLADIDTTILEEMVRTAQQYVDTMSDGNDEYKE